jgi:deoxyxylulose-5-phosphate synthase
MFSPLNGSGAAPRTWSRNWRPGFQRKRKDSDAPKKADHVSAASPDSQRRGVAVRERSIFRAYRETLRRVRTLAKLLVTIEENNLPGGFGEGVMAALAAEGASSEAVLRLGLGDVFVTHGSRAELLAEVGLDADGILRQVREALSR